MRPFSGARRGTDGTKAVVGISLPAGKEEKIPENLCSILRSGV
jgi:hypothetical protein